MVVVGGRRRERQGGGTSDWLKFVDGGDYFMVDSVALKNSGW